MHSEPLEKYEVAYFVFPYKGMHSFWNKNVSYPLSLAFLNSDNEIWEFDTEERANQMKNIFETNSDSGYEYVIKKI